MEEMAVNGRLSTNEEEKTCIIVNCLKKESCYKFIGYFGSLGEAMYGYNKGYPVHLNQIDKNDWTLLIE